MTREFLNHWLFDVATTVTNEYRRQHGIPVPQDNRSADDLDRDVRNVSEQMAADGIDVGASA